MISGTVGIGFASYRSEKVADVLDEGESRYDFKEFRISAGVEASASKGIAFAWERPGLILKIRKLGLR
jgi:hypothetical protein